MANTRVVLAKMKELHFKMGGAHPQVLIGVVAKELSLTHEAVHARIADLKKSKMINQTSSDAIELTVAGIAN